VEIKVVSAPDFNKIAILCDGMLSPSIYRRVYEAALHSDDGLIVEVGTAHGAATIALALGLRDSEKTGRVITFGRWPSETVKRNLRIFGVEDLVEVITGDVGDTASTVPESSKISVLMLDADGRIDRDFLQFFNQVVPRGVIIIDDCADVVRIHRTSLSTVQIDAKMRLTYLLLLHFKGKGIISAGRQFGQTYFGEKLCGPNYQFDLVEILEVYRKMVFTSAATTPLQTLRRLGLMGTNAISPALAQRLRVLYRNKRDQYRRNETY
jgi:precorrin-6B methylase 2